MWVYSYTCPNCDEYSHKVDARKSRGGVTIQCPECDAIEEIKDDQDISRTVNDTRQELNDVVNEVINPERWETSN